MVQKQHFVTIKGTKDGLIFLLDDSCSFQDMIEELKEKLSTKYHQLFEGPTVNVKVRVGNRYLTAEEQDQLRELIGKENNLHVDEIDSNVISKMEAEELWKDTQVVTVAKIIRSGQVLEIKGDLLLLGDVNPGGTVLATGNIHVMGSLRGVAHAGVDGNEDSVITAARMAPSQLRIAQLISSFQENDEEVDNEMECAYIEKLNGDPLKITIDRVQHIGKHRPNITRL